MGVNEALATVIIWALMQLIKILSPKVPLLKNVDPEKLKKLIPILSIIIGGGVVSATGVVDNPASAAVAGGLAIAANEVGKSVARAGGMKEWN